MVSRLDVFGMDGMAWNKTVIINTGRVSMDNFDLRQASQAELDARRMTRYAASFLRKYVPGFEDAFIISTAPSLGVRITRWIDGEYVLSREEVKAGCRFDDVVALHVTKALKGNSVQCDIPYGCVIPRNVDSLLIGSGKSVSTAPPGLLRGMGSCMFLGEATGTAAALSAKLGATPRSLDVKELQKALVRQGAYIGDEDRLQELGVR